MTHENVPSTIASFNAETRTAETLVRARRGAVRRRPASVGWIVGGLLSLGAAWLGACSSSDDKPGAENGAAGMAGAATDTGQAGGGQAGSAVTGGVGSGGGSACSGSTCPPPNPSCAASPLCRGESCCVPDAITPTAFPLGRGTGTDACPLMMRCDASETPERSVRLSPFALDRYEVTVARFRAFVGAYDSWRPTLVNAADDTLGKHAALVGSGWRTAFNAALPASAAALATAVGAVDTCVGADQTITPTWTPTAATHEALPITCVTWVEAFAFCLWDGGRLPTEAEWEYAAAGGSENRLYPWGAEPPGNKNEYASYYVDSVGCLGDGQPTCTFADIRPVGSYEKGKSRFGPYDLAGNVWEFTRDTFPQASPPATHDPSQPLADPQQGMVIRGGAFGNQAQGASGLRAAARFLVTPATVRFRDLGIRCAR